MPVTIKAKLLLGWMPRNEALQFLMNSCVFDAPMTEVEAENLWQSYRVKVAALAGRTCRLPESLTLSKRERIAIMAFRASPKYGMDSIQDIIKIDPRCLVLHQFFVVTERSKEYAALMRNDRQRIKHCFGLDKQEIKTVVNGAVTTLKLPHFEYNVNPVPLPNGQVTINIAEWPRYISAVHRGDRILLWGGYHRSYAFLANSFNTTEPEGPDDPPLVTLITNPPVNEFFSPNSQRPEVRDCVLGDCPAMFSDFFDPDLCMEVSLIKRQSRVILDSANQTWWHGLVDSEF